MNEYYYPADVVNQTGVSASTLRNYTKHYVGYLTAAATPGEGQKRVFTEQDLKLVAFIKQKTSKRGEGLSHEAVKAAIDRGELEDFELPSKSTGETDTALATAENSSALMLLIEQLREREENYRQRDEEQQLEIVALQRELGTAQGRMLELEKQNKRLSRPWWKKVLGME